LPARAKATAGLARGTVYANLTVERKGLAPSVKINEQVLAAVVAALKALEGKVEAERPTLDGILALKGVIEVGDSDEGEEERRAGRDGNRRGLRRDARRPDRQPPRRRRNARPAAHRPAQ